MPMLWGGGRERVRVRVRVNERQAQARAGSAASQRLANLGSGSCEGYADDARFERHARREKLDRLARATRASSLFALRALALRFFAHSLISEYPGTVRHTRMRLGAPSVISMRQ